MKTRVVWDCEYPNPSCISRFKYYEYEVNGNIVVVRGDGDSYTCNKEDFLKRFRAEVGTLDLNTKPTTKIDIPTDK